VVPALPAPPLVPPAPLGLLGFDSPQLQRIAAA